MKKNIVLLALCLFPITACNSGDGGGVLPPDPVNLRVDYENCGTEIPLEWNDNDNSSTTRNASYEINESSFGIQFIGKWRISTNNQEIMAKKDPVSFIRSNSDLVIKTMIVESFSADFYVYTSNDCTGERLTGSEVTAVHGDGDAYEYTINSATWSIKAVETYKERSIDNSYQDTNGYLNNSVHWFKYEPISWRVLDVEGGKAFLMADIVIDSQHFHTSSNNYENSYIRSWLNNDFYDTAFNIEEKLNIEMTTVDNSLASTGRETNPYICNDTEDNVFLLSYVEANDESYGLNTTASRLLGPSDYAKSQGVIMNENKSNWWLRTPHFSLAYSGFNVYEGMFNADFVDYTSIGVVPALWISL